MARQEHNMRYKIRFNTDKAEYRRQFTYLTKSIKKEKIKWESELGSRVKHDPKLIYSYVRCKMNEKKQINTLKDDEGRLTVDKSEIADILKTHFESMLVKSPQIQFRIWKKD